MQSKTTISVVIPTYNRGQELVTAVQSALTQTYPVKEVLVCDDGSTDNSRELVLALNDKRVLWLDCGRNGRPAIPRNKGILKAASEWVAFLDSDDSWLPGKTELQLKLAEKEKYQAVCSNGWKVDGQGQKKIFFDPTGIREFGLKEMMEFNHVICSSMICRKEILLRYLLFPEEKKVTALEDYVLWLKIAANCKIAYCDEPLLYYKDIPAVSIRKEGLDSVQQRTLIFNYLKRQKQFFTREQLLYLYEKFKWFYKPPFWKKYDLEKMML